MPDGAIFWYGNNVHNITPTAASMYSGTYAAQPYIAYSGTNFVAYQPNYSAVSNGYLITDKIDITNYNNIKMKCTCSATTYQYSGITLQLSDTNTTPIGGATQDQYIVSKYYNVTSFNGVKTEDISLAQGEKYICIGFVDDTPSSSNRCTISSCTYLYLE